MVARILSVIDDNIEHWVMIVSYFILTIIVGFDVIARFLIKYQTPWGSELAMACFVILVWFGCANGIKHNAHLSFPGIRERLPAKVRRSLQVIDGLLWIILSGVIYFGLSKITTLDDLLDTTVFGTNIKNVWIDYFVIAGWVAICCRSMQMIVRCIKS